MKRRPSSDLRRQLRFEMGQAPFDLRSQRSVRPGSAHSFEWKGEKERRMPDARYAWRERNRKGGICTRNPQVGSPPSSPHVSSEQ